MIMNQETEPDFEGFHDWWYPHRDDQAWMDEHFIDYTEGELPPGFKIYKTVGVGVTYVDSDGYFWLQSPEDTLSQRQMVVDLWRTEQALERNDSLF